MSEARFSLVRPNYMPLAMLQQIVLLAISGVWMSDLLRKLFLRNIGGSTSRHRWQLVDKMAPTWNFILQVCKFFGSFVIYRVYYTSAVSKFEMKSKSNCVCDNRNVFKCVLFITEFWSCLKSENFATFLGNYDYTDMCVCVCVCVFEQLCCIIRSTHETEPEIEKIPSITRKEQSEGIQMELQKTGT